MGKCRESTITIDTSTLERIVYEPQAVLDDEIAFWEEEKPQEYTKLWAEAVGYTIPFDEWREQIRGWARLPPAERETHELMRHSRAIMDGREGFVRTAIPHLCSYLPADADLNVTVRLTAFIRPNAFAWQDIIINLTSPYWKGRVENIWNLLVHEIFHAGYSYCRDLRQEEELEDKTAYKMLDSLHSEGVCTYVGYRALPLFPAPDVEDYALLESHDAIDQRLRDVNEAFSKVGEGEDAVQAFVWERCVLGRAYYVVGAHMCQVIEERAGRTGLLDTLVQGPASFVALYNSFAPEERRVRAGV